MSWISKNKKKKTKILYEISKCAINMCVVVLPLGVKFLAMKIWLLLLMANSRILLGILLFIKFVVYKSMISSF